MLLDIDSIKRLNLLSGGKDSDQPASVPLTIGTLITNGKEIYNGKIMLPPQGMIMAVSNEVFDLKDKQVIGYTTVKNALSRKGIWALNIGIVDAGWRGPISSILINFSKQEQELETGDEFLRITFHAYQPLPVSTIDSFVSTPSHKQLSSIDLNNEIKSYIKNRKPEFRAMMDEKFLMLGKLKDELTGSITTAILTRFAAVAFVITAISAGLTVWDKMFTDEKPQEYYEKLITQSNQNLIKENEALRDKQGALEIKMQVLEIRMKELQDSSNTK